MFGIFKKRPRIAVSPDEVAVMHSAVKAVVGRQLLQSGRSWDDLLKSRFTLGYLHGVCDATAQKRGISEDEDLLVLGATLIQLFPYKPELFAALGQLQDDPQFASGQHWGGTDLLKSISDRGHAPSGLTEYWAATPVETW